jgi:hypothetical protein
MKLEKSNEFSNYKPYFFATYYSKDYSKISSHLLIITNTNNKDSTIFKSKYCLNPCYLRFLRDNQYQIYKRNWHFRDFIVVEIDSSIISYLEFSDSTNLEVKVYLSPHGSNKFNPIFYALKNQDQQYYKIYIKDFEKITPLNESFIKGFITNNNINTYIFNKNQLIKYLIEYGFTSKYNDHHSSLNFLLGSNNYH